MTQSRAPRHLSPQSRQLWYSTLAAYSLREDELRVLELALVASDRARNAAERLDIEGLTTSGKFGPRVNPLVSVERSSSLTAARLLRQLGFADDGELMPKVLQGA
jgi:phage terminase small subunit